ncbi:MAG: hypothetical protein ABIL53_02815 [candidate division WOR-3 bacterium]
MREIYGGLETPFYVYDREKIEEKCNKLLNGFPFAKILYSVKANSNPEILKVIKGCGLDFEVVYLVADARFIIKRDYPYIIRPALYGVKHSIRALKSSVGPVFGVYELPIMRKEDMVVIEEAGAYGYSMASNYNGRPKPAEYMLENGGLRIIRPRQDYRVL